MSFESSNLVFDKGRNGNRSGDGRKVYGLAIGQSESGCGVVELLGAVGLEAIGKLIGEAVVASSPVIGEGGKYRCHGMVCMAGDCAFGAEGHHHVRAKFTDAASDVRDDFVEVQAVKLAVRVVENKATRNFENLAGGGEFFAAECGQFGVALGVSPIGSSLSWREAEDESFDAAFVVEAEGTTESAGFIVRMSGDAHETEHEVIVA